MIKSTGATVMSNSRINEGHYEYVVSSTYQVNMLPTQHRGAIGEFYKDNSIKDRPSIGSAALVINGGAYQIFLLDKDGWVQCDRDKRASIDDLSAQGETGIGGYYTVNADGSAVTVSGGVLTDDVAQYADTVELWANVEEVTQGALTSGVKTIKFLGNTPPIMKNAILENSGKLEAVYVPKSSIGDYEKSKGLAAVKDKIVGY